ncbi:hypothetical protein Cgig2_029228 [Carnegiea gigantea]|uniref:Uncharacterized protein n=1 Tax=Carnegiea gigantea TaxID=171969 RepID=A0A9Q1JH53_9CARY|nr:hypothetical protein Cgig2_029228 [Carnegiea gigantea]
MYREGPVGSPFHSLLVEGYIDAPLDVYVSPGKQLSIEDGENCCLHHPLWFPEIRIPTFKLVVAKTLQKVRIGEQISLVRMKLSWPLSSREAILHYFEFEYLEDDLLIVLLNTIPDVATSKMETHGFTNEGIPDTGNTVRIDVVGGFALQKLSMQISPFRIMLTPVQFSHVLCSVVVPLQIVASAAKGDEDFAKALNDPLYRRIREAVLSDGKSKRYVDTKTNGEEHGVPAQDVPRKDENMPREDYAKVIANGHVNGSLHHDNPSNEIEEEDIRENPEMKCETVSGLGDMFKAEDQETLGNGPANGYPIQYTPATEIQEEEVEEIKNTADSWKVNNVGDIKEDIISTDHRQLENLLKKVQISPEVEQAVGTLDKMITAVREGKLKARGSYQSILEIEGDKTKKSAMENHFKLGDELGISTEEEIPKSAAHPSKNGHLVDVLRSSASDFQSGVASHASTSAYQHTPLNYLPCHSPPAGSSPAFVSQMTVEVDGSYGCSPVENQKTRQRKRWRLCCWQLISKRMVS